jgi:hypothetical protein
MVDAAIAKGRPPPDWFENDNVVLPAAAEFYMAAFWDLSTCRPMGMTVGPIPWDKIQAYAEFADLNRELAQVFGIVIRRMDIVFMDDMREQSEKARNATQEQTNKETDGYVKK